MSLLTPEIIEDICGQFNQDGVCFRLVDLDEDNERVRLLLDLSEVECADCVMPPEHLRRLITTGIRQRSAKVFDVVLDDPRREQRKGNGLAAAAGTVEVLDPTAPAEASDADSGPDVGALQGKTVLIRLDTLWRSWDWTTEEWEKQLEALGARVLTIRRTRGVPGTQGVRLQAEFE